MTKVEQSVGELERHLRDSIGFLEASCVSFDAGFLGEAKRLAATIRVLLHDTRNSHSLLGLLGVKSGIGYITTATTFNPKNLLGHCGLVGFSLGPNGPKYWAPLGDGPPHRYSRAPCNFNAWWNEIVIVDTKGNRFTRCELVLSLANKDGGAHVDPQLDSKYADLTRGNSLGYVGVVSGEESPLSDIELHSVREIAYELLRSLRMHGYGSAAA